MTRVLALAALLSPIALPATPRTAGARPTAQGEGPLRNDAYQAIDEAAAGHLARGDVLIHAALDPAGELDPARAVAGFEAWRQACEEAAAGAAVPLDLARFQERPPPPWPDPRGTAGRRTEALPYGVLRRLDALGPAARRLWEQHFGPLSRERLHHAGLEPEALDQLERSLPGTSGAARAALRRADQELEAGRPVAAALLLERAALHGSSAADAQVLDAVTSRREQAAQLLAAATPLEPRQLEHAPARTLVLESLEGFSDPSIRGTPRPSAPRGARGGSAGRGRGRAQGLSFLEDGRLAITGPELVWLRGGEGPTRSFSPEALLAERDLEPRPLAAPLGAAPVPCLPASDGHDLWLVRGRAQPAANLGNVLLCLRPPADLSLPELRWALGSFGLAGPDGAAAPRPLEHVLGDGLWEFQPGPLLAQDLLFVQARRFAVTRPADGEPTVEVARAQAWLLALDAATGQPRWKRFLGEGGAVASETQARHLGPPQVTSPADPLAWVGPRLLAGTGLGFGALVEAPDGRIAWSFLSRRRRLESPGWRVLGPPPVDASQSEPRVFWAPGDSDHLYLLRGVPDVDGQGLLLAPPDPIDQGEEVLAGEGRIALVLGAQGPRRSLETRDLVEGTRRRSLHLLPGERFLGGGLVTPRRVLVASERGLYLFDRERELLLLDHAPFEVEARAPSGGIFMRGPQVLVLAGGALRRFRVE